MIDEEKTFAKYGYYGYDLKPKAHRRVVAVCDECGKIRFLMKQQYRDLCRSCTLKKQWSLPLPKFVPEEERFITGTGIDRIKTVARFGYDPADLTQCSHREVLTTCAVCGETRIVKRMWCHSALCRICSIKTVEYRRKMGKIKLGNTTSDEAKLKISEANTGDKHYMFGKHRSEEARIKQSCTLQGIDVDEFDGFVKGSLYCNKFDEKCRESNREKYGRTCFLCGKTEEENGRKLDVHHVDMRKSQGCDGEEWKLVPLCKVCHGHCHGEIWKSRIVYLLNTPSMDVI